MRRSVPSDFGKKVEGRGNGKRDVNQVGTFQGGSKIAGERLFDGGARLRFANDFEAVPAGDVHFGCVFAQSEGEGAADEAGAKDSYARDEVGGHWRSDW